MWDAVRVRRSERPRTRSERPRFERIQPLPDEMIFLGAAAMSMRGDHIATESLFVAMLQTALAGS